MSLAGVAFKAGRMLGAFRMVGAIALPLLVAGGIAWFWSTASAAGRAHAEIEALTGIVEANRAAAARLQRSNAELLLIARETSLADQARTRKLSELEDSVSAADGATTGECPLGCRLPRLSWPWESE